MDHMLAESDFTAPHFPCASVIAMSEILRVIAFDKRQSLANICLFLCKSKRAACQNYTQNPFDFHSSPL